MASPATAVRPTRRVVVAAAAKQNVPQKALARTGVAAAAAAALLVVPLSFGMCLDDKASCIMTCWRESAGIHKLSKFTADLRAFRT